MKPHFNVTVNPFQCFQYIYVYILVSKYYTQAKHTEPDEGKVVLEFIISSVFSLSPSWVRFFLWWKVEFCETFKHHKPLKWSSTAKISYVENSVRQKIHMTKILRRKSRPRPWLPSSSWLKLCTEAVLLFWLGRPDKLLADLPSERVGRPFTTTSVPEK